MSLYTNPLDQVVESINRLNNVALIAGDYNFGQPSAVTVRGNGINTEVTLTAKGSQSAYSGSRTFGYHRLDLSELAVQAPLIIPVHNILTIADVWGALNSNFGTVFTAADFAARDLTTAEKTIPSSITLQALATSYGWTGSTQVTTRIGGYKLADYLTVSALTGLNYPAPVSTRPYAWAYSYSRDFSDQHAGLDTVQTGTAQLAAVQAALTAITGDAWTLSGVGQYSLGNATVTAVGTTASTTGYNTDYVRYVSVQLDPAQCTGLLGSLVLHYNQS
jgi:hypothetical protein